MQPHVFIATPCYGGLVTQGYMQSVVALMSEAGRMGVDLTLAMLGQDALITRSRNTLVGQFLGHAAATHLLFVDADISFRPNDLQRLLQARKPLIAGIYPLKAYYWDNSFRQRHAAGEAVETAGLHYVGAPSEPHATEDGLIRADFAGTGFMLIERGTFETMIAAYPETRYVAVDAYRTGPDGPAINHALFDCFIDSDTGAYRSEDFAFCWRWRRIGGEIWLDTAAQLTHTGASDFTGAPATRFNIAS